MHLYHIEMVGLEPVQALLDPGNHVRARVDVRLAFLVGSFEPNLAGALRRQDNVIAAVRRRLADQALAQSVIDGGVDVIDPEIDHSIDERDSLAFVNGAGTRSTGEFHGAVAEPAHQEVSDWARSTGELGLTHAILPPL